MTAALVGHTGFVGGNLMGQRHFDACFASRTIDDIAGRSFDLLVISAVPAQMWLANNHPERDLANIRNLYEWLKRAKARRTVLISTIAVYSDPSAGPDESAQDVFEVAKPYGRHRREFETMVADAFSDLLIVRLPALFGRGLSKNFIFDLLNPVPSFISGKRLAEVRQMVSARERVLIDAAFEVDPPSDLFRFRRDQYRDPAQALPIERIVERCGIAARNFTAGHSRFQFYNLDRLWADISRGMEAGLSVLNLATEPLRASEVARRLTGTPLESNEAPAVLQDMRSRHSALWGRSDGYLYGAQAILDDLTRFHEREKQQVGQ
jgi:hypothetical protein